MNRDTAFGLVGITSLIGLIVLSFSRYEVKAALHTNGHYHSVGHVLVFGGITVLLLNSVKALSARITLTVSIAALGFVLEELQHKIFGQQLEVRDVWFDALGVVAGMALVLFLKHSDSGAALQ